MRDRLPRNLAFLGDSITAGKRQPEGTRWTALLQSELDKIRPSTWAVFNRGMPGRTLRDAVERFEKDVLDLLPGTVFLQSGLNDCTVQTGRRIPRVGLAEFRDCLLEIVRLVRDEGGEAVLMTNHPVRKNVADEGGNLARRLESYHETLRAAAREAGCALIDVERGFPGGQEGSHLAEDGIHLCHEGHAAYARVVLDAMRSGGLL